MIRKSFALLIFVLLAGLLAGSPLLGDDSDAGKSDAKPDKPGSADSKTPTCKVEKGTLKVEVALKGTLEADEKTEVMLKPEAYSQPLVIKKVLDHGARVKKGDVLLEIDREKIDRAIVELKAERDLALLNLRQAEEELPLLEKSTPMDLADAERAKKLADEDLKKFLDIDRPLAVEFAQLFVKNATHSVEYAKEELRQLEKMYRSKDLTEETEEIILKRQRHMVEMTEQMLKNAIIRRDETLKIQLPRQEYGIRENVLKTALGLERAKATLPITLNQKRLALAKLRYDNDRSAERLKHLEKDRDTFTVRSPADGIVYLGKCTQGQWSTSTILAKMFPGGSVAAEEVFMTVVNPRSVFVNASVEEKDLHLVHAGMKGRAVLAGFPDLKLPAEVTRVANVPHSAGSFQVRIGLSLSSLGDVAMPGMACTVKCVAYTKDDALLVPSATVFTEDSDEDVQYVYHKGKTGKPVKTVVKVGKTSNGKTEILAGVKENEEILTAKP